MSRVCTVLCGWGAGLTFLCGRPSPRRRASGGLGVSEGGSGEGLRVVGATAYDGCAPEAWSIAKEKLLESDDSTAQRRLRVVVSVTRSSAGRPGREVRPPPRSP